MLKVYSNNCEILKNQTNKWKSRNQESPETGVNIPSSLLFSGLYSIGTCKGVILPNKI